MFEESECCRSKESDRLITKCLPPISWVGIFYFIVGVYPISYYIKHVINGSIIILMCTFWASSENKTQFTVYVGLTSSWARENGSPILGQRRPIDLSVVDQMFIYALVICLNVNIRRLNFNKEIKWAQL